jgi:hypothetical protein
MDATVIAAMLKWPDVPDVYGWLSLTARGEWRIKGQAIAHPGIREFIDRNYAADARGCWYFQNGPQRVFVALQETPWIYRVDVGGALTTHTAAVPTVSLAAALLDDSRMLLHTDLGAGMVDDRDSAWFLRCVTDRAGRALNEQGLNRWLDGRDEAWLAPHQLGLDGGAKHIERVARATLEQRYGFVRMPGP